MRNKFLIIAGLSVCGIIYATNDKDPVIMTVNGVDVPKSEFEYLYRKNNQQQLEIQPIDDYIEMFSIYKLKVEDAKAHGIDTTSAFKKEMQQYRRELAAPYIADSAFIYELVDIALDRSKEEVEASHIMMMKSRDKEADKKNMALLDSIRTELLNGGDFSKLATEFSQDRSVKFNEGYLGYISSGRFPYEFESAVYNMSPGEISEIIESPVAFHIVKSGARRPTRGRVEAAHIMKMVPQTATPELKEKIKNKIDSLYSLVKNNPEEFGNIARESSDDKSSARNDGILPEFGAGEMVPVFEEVSFSLQEGEISQPFLSPYGWHIVKKISSRPGKSKEEIKADALQKINSPQDSRFGMVYNHNMEKLAKKYNATLNNKNIDKLKISAQQAGIDSLYLANWTTMPNSDMEMANIKGKKINAKSVVKALKKNKEKDSESLNNLIDEAVKKAVNETLLEEEEEYLLKENADYRNLMKEYEDGSLLYEISLQEIWDKAAKDEEGLELFFEKNRKKYILDSPKAKGILVQALNDSIGNEVREMAKGLPVDSVILNIKKNFKGRAVAEKVLASQGVNAMVDNIMFGGDPTKPTAPGYKVFFMLDERIINLPESVEDVKSTVITDYQQRLEEDWIKEMKKKYPVKLNKKEIKKIE